MPNTETMVVIFKRTKDRDRINTTIEYVGDHLVSELKRYYAEQVLAQEIDNTTK